VSNSEQARAVWRIMQEEGVAGVHLVAAERVADAIVRGHGASV
jgi:hypothetical protein